ncbi:MAG: aspartate/glutamate racemase family protein [Nocardioides sp.]
MPPIGFLHTAQVHVPTFEAIVRDAGSSAPCLHLVDPNLLAEIRSRGRTASVEEATLSALERLADNGATVIVCTCSTLGPVAEAVAVGRPVSVVRVDRPMARAAVRMGSRIGVIAAVDSTLQPTRALLEEEARRAGVRATITAVSLPEAWIAFESGDSAEYVRQVADAARWVADSVDVVVLAQASMSDVTTMLSDLPVPVIASPRLAVQHVLGLSVTPGSGERGQRQ